MRKIFLFLILLLFFSCGEKPDASFSTEFLLGSVGRAVLPQYEPIAEPMFDSDQSFWTSVKYDKRILNKKNLDGFEEDRITLYLYPAAQEIRNIALSEDGSTALLNIAYDGTSESHIARIIFGSSDHKAFQLDGSQNVMVPNPSSLAITSLCYPWPDQLVYLGTEYDSPTNTAVQRLYVYNFLSNSTQVIDLNPGLYSTDNEGKLLGDYYYRVDVFSNSESPGVINEFLVSQRIESPEGTTHSFKIIGTDGSVSFDAAGVYEYQEIGGIRWLNENEVLLAAKRDDIWQILSVNSDGIEQVYFEGNSRIYELKGLDLSPSGDRCMTQIFYNEFDSYSEILVQSLY